MQRRAFLCRLKFLTGRAHWHLGATVSGSLLALIGEQRLTVLSLGSSRYPQVSTPLHLCTRVVSSAHLPFARMLGFAASTGAAGVNVKSEP